MRDSLFIIGSRATRGATALYWEMIVCPPGGSSSGGRGQRETALSARLTLIRCERTAYLFQKREPGLPALLLIA